MNFEFKFYLLTFLGFLGCLLPVLLSVAFLTLIERKVLAAIQRRRGPNLVGVLGLLQPFADAMKLIFKETVFPNIADKAAFIFAAWMSLFLSLWVWVVIPFGLTCVVSDLDLGLLFIFSISSLNVYAIIVAGWSSNSRYAFLGALRSAAQMISYEVSLGLLIMPVILLSHSLNLSTIILHQAHIWYIFPLFPIFFYFFIASLAETNRPPFDLPEAEAELVSGYNVEYSSISFAFFFIAEYSNIIMMSSLSAMLFFGGWVLFPVDIHYFSTFADLYWFYDLFSRSDGFMMLLGPVVFALKILFFAFVFIWVRASVPRYRYDQLMDLSWQHFLPYALGWLFFFSSLTFILFRVL